MQDRIYEQGDCNSDCACDAQSDGSGAGEGAGAIGGGRGSGRVVPEISVGTVFKPRPEGSILRDWRDGVRKGQLEHLRKADCVGDHEARRSRSTFPGCRRDHSASGVPKPSFLWQFARWCGGNGVLSVDGDKPCQRRPSSHRQVAPAAEGRRHPHRSSKTPAPQHPTLRDWCKDHAGSHQDKDTIHAAPSFEVAADDLIQLGTYAAHWKSAGKLDVTTAAALRRVL